MHVGYFHPYADPNFSFVIPQFLFRCKRFWPAKTCNSSPLLCKSVDQLLVVDCRSQNLRLEIAAKSKNEEVRCLIGISAMNRRSCDRKQILIYRSHRQLPEFASACLVNLFFVSKVPVRVHRSKTAALAGSQCVVFEWGLCPDLVAERIPRVCFL